MSTIVLCGSLGAASEMWAPQLQVLRGHEVVCVDHPGHGGAQLVDFAEIGDLAERVLAQVEAERFSFVGVSLGGAVGMQLALDEPTRVERLVLCCASPQFGSAESWHERAALVRARGVAAIAEAVLARWFTPEFEDVERFREMLLATDDEGYARCCDALANWDVRDELGRIAASTLCVAGADDPTSPPEHLAQIAEAVGGEYHVIDRARHLATVERAGEVNVLLTEFLA